MSNVVPLPGRTPGETQRVIPTRNVSHPDKTSPAVHRTGLVAAGLSGEAALPLIARIRDNQRICHPNQLTKEMPC
ncbi:hypothetical protein ABH940_003401 [Streptacidiphilus sp. BW17]|uniref:hypothetical protein n=1 Tax=Streptacidiphilus sp. BW17 TaxID=3156274 RepID=UPI0035166508